MTRLVRCNACPRCGSGSYRKVRADAVLSIFKVWECRRCSQQYKMPAPVWRCLLLMLIGAGMGVWFAIEAKRVGFNKYLFDPIWPAVLAGVGAIVILYAMYKLVFGRGIKAPARQDWRERTEPIPPAVPKGDNIVLIAPTGVMAAHVSDFESKAPAPGPFIKPTIASPQLTPSPATVASTASIVLPPVHTPAVERTISHARSDSKLPMPAASVLSVLRRGTVIPAHPMALNKHRELDHRRMKAITRYYLAAGVGGLAVGVHTTQFAIRKPKFNLLRPVLDLVAKEMKHHEETTGKTLVKVAGVCGDTRQAVGEAQLAASLGYDMGLLNLAALPADATEFQLIDHCKKVAEILPIFGFYLQPGLGGRPLPFSFWRAFVEIPNVLAIKIATFNRYNTIDVMRAVAESGRALQSRAVGSANPIAIYTGNDDTIVSDLLGDWTFDVNGKPVSQRIVGGLLGHWACWTHTAVQTLERIKMLNEGDQLPADVAVLDRQVSDMNAAIFDAANGFKGAIPGVHEVLRRQGLLEGIWCLDSDMVLSPGQAEEITRVCNAYPHLTDDAFVREHLSGWLN